MVPDISIAAAATPEGNAVKDFWAIKTGLDGNWRI
jgi:hypothetical protein